MFNYSFVVKELPKTLGEAYISLILKKGKSPDLCSSYRPIALLNVDRKLLSKILAMRLEKILPTIIGTDQTGFIQGRNSSDNIRRLLNVIYTFKVKSIEGLVLSLDAEKAFDRIEWSYLFFVLDKFGLGENFVQWIRVLYTDPCSAVLTNGFRSDYFPMHRGTRQGCPLSPLLFAMAIESLAEAIRSAPFISGLQIGHIYHKIALYADDVLIFLSEPEKSVPALIELINWFSTFSGYKVNLTKSEAMPLGTLISKPNTVPCFPFKWSPLGFVYLGISISTSLKQMYESNFVPLFEKIRQDLERWNSLPVSLLGRIAIVKMIVLPKLLYPIRMVPIMFSNRALKGLNSWLTSFIWSKRKPRLKLSVLYLPSSMGGLDFPNIKMYQLSSHLRYIAEWVRNDSSSTWLDIESSFSQFPLRALLFVKSFQNIKEIYDNPIIVNTLKAWRSVCRLEGRSKLTSFFTPILNNPDFTPGILDDGFKRWCNLGLNTLGDMFSDNKLMAFVELTQKYQLFKYDFFRFLQLRHYITKNTTLVSNCEISSIERLLFLSSGKMSLGRFYGAMCSISSADTQRIKTKWEEELATDIDDET